jgi:hypothetical protein
LSVRARLTLKARALAPCSLRVSLNHGGPGTQPLTRVAGTLDYGEVTVPPGESILTLETSEPARPGAGGDARPLTVAVYALVLSAVPER